MNTLLDYLAVGSLIAGLFFFLAGVIGLVRLPDVYHRMHAVTKCATLGIIGLALAAALHTPEPVVIVKCTALIAFVFIANPVGSHMLARAAHKDGVRQWEGLLSDALEEDKNKTDADR